MNVNYSNISTALKQQSDSSHNDVKRVTSKIALAVQSNENKQVQVEKPTTTKSVPTPNSAKKTTSDIKSEPKSIKSPIQLLESFATTLKNSNLSKPTLLNYLESIDTSSKKLNAQDIKNIYTLIKDEPNLEKFKQKLAKFIESIATVEGDELKQKVKDSGVFLESKLLKEDRENIKQKLSSTLNDIKNSITTSLSNQSPIKTTLHVEDNSKQNITTKELQPETKSALHVEDKNNKQDVIIKIEKIINELKKDIEITPKVLKNIESVAKEVTLHVKDDFRSDESTKKIHTIIKDFSNFEKKELNLNSIIDKISNKIVQLELIKEPLLDFSKVIDKIQSSFKEIVAKIPVEKLNEFNKVSSLIKVEPRNIEALKKIVQDPTIFSGEKISYLHVDDKNELKLPTLQRDGTLLRDNVEKLKEIVNDLKQYASSTSSKALNPLQTLSNIILKHKVPTPQERELIAKELVKLDSPKSVIKEVKELLKPEQITKSNAKIFLEVNRVAQSLKVDLPQVLKTLDALVPLKQSVEQLTQTAVTQEQKVLHELSKMSSDSVVKNIKNFILNSDTSTLEAFIKEDEFSKSYTKLEKIIKDVSNELTQANIKNSSKKLVAPNTLHVKSEITSDLKATLLQLNEESEKTVKNSSTKEQLHSSINKVLNQMDINQVYSFLTSTTTTFVPYLWEGLEDGKFSIKKFKDESFTCEINLSLEKYGKLDVLMMLYEKKRLNVSIYAEQKDLSDKIDKNMQELKRSFSSVGVILTNMKLYAYEQKPKTQMSDISKIDMEFGLDLKI